MSSTLPETPNSTPNNGVNGHDPPGAGICCSNRQDLESDSFTITTEDQSTRNKQYQKPSMPPSNGVCGDAGDLQLHDSKDNDNPMSESDFGPKSNADHELEVGNTNGLSIHLPRTDTGELDYQAVVNKLHSLNTTELGAAEKIPPINFNEGSYHICFTDQFGVDYVRYESEKQMAGIMRLISKDLSEPYSIYTYRYFIHNWPHLCFLAMDKGEMIGAIVCKIDTHKRTLRSRGYIAMLAVDNAYRRKKIGSNLVRIAIDAIINDRADEIVLETECTNMAALHLYEKLGFVRDKRLFRYYLNGVDAFRLKLWIT